MSKAYLKVILSETPNCEDDTTVCSSLYEFENRRDDLTESLLKERCSIAVPYILKKFNEIKWGKKMRGTVKNMFEQDYADILHSLFGKPISDSDKSEKSMTRQDHHNEIVNILVDLNDAIKIYDGCCGNVIGSDEREQLNILQKTLIGSARILKDIYKII
jgi:hypothetical protein